MTLYDIVEADRESVDRNIQHILEKGQHPVGERQYRRRDGSKVDVEVSVSLVFMGGRQTMCVVAHDITERKRTEEALQEVREAERSRTARNLHDGLLQDIVYALQETSILQAISEDGGAQSSKRSPMP